MASGHSGNVITNLRVAAIAVATYDALWTLPAEVHLYREQKSFRKMTRACLLFILIRYISIITMILSNIGFFSHGFTHSACQKYYLFSPIFKVFQTVISQLIIAVRTIAVARQSKWVLWTVGVLFVIAVTLEFFSNIWHRIPFQIVLEGAVKGNCSSGNMDGEKIAWIHYMAAMLYDATCLAITTGHIWLQNGENPSHSLDTLTRMLLKEGVLYFCFLTAANTLNLVFYIINSEEFQTAGANIGYVLTWIMSQRLLIHLREYRRKHSDWSQSKPHGNIGGFPTFIQSRPGINLDHVELGVHVTVEEAIKNDLENSPRTGASASPHSHSSGHKGHMQHQDGEESFYEWWNKDRKASQIQNAL